MFLQFELPVSAEASVLLIKGGINSYHNRFKNEILGVSKETLSNLELVTVRKRLSEIAQFVSKRFFNLILDCK